YCLSAPGKRRKPALQPVFVFSLSGEAPSKKRAGGGRGIRTHEGLHPSGFQGHFRAVRHRSRTFANVRAIFNVGRARPPTFANVRHSSPTLPSPLPSKR